MTLFARFFLLVLSTFICIPAELFCAPPPTLTIAHSSSMPPLSFIDEYGKPQGIIIDVWKLWSDKTNIPVKFKLTNWANSIISVERGEVDVHGGLFYTQDRADKLYYSKKICYLNGGLFVSKKIVGFKMDDLNNFKCGVVKKDYSKQFIEEKFPYLTLIIFNSSKDLLSAAAAGNIQVFATDYSVATYQLNHSGAKNAFTYYNLFTKPLYPAVSNKRLNEYEKIYLGMISISESEIEKITHNRLNEKETSNNVVPSTTILLVLSSLLFVIFIKTKSSKSAKHKNNL